MASHHGGAGQPLDRDTTPHGKDTDILNDYHHADMDKFCSKLVISVTEHLVEVVDKLSTTTVVFFRSERILKCQHLYGA